MKINRILRGLLLFLGIIGILDTFLLLLYNGGVNLGTILPGVVGGLLILWSSVKAFFRKFVPMGKIGPWSSKARQVVFSLFLIGLISFLVVEGTIIIYSQPDPVVEADYLIILGAGLNGEQLSSSLWERMQKGLDYLEKHPMAKVVLSGGQGPGENILFVI
ncbi:conserved membrane hypothetical protein [Candidatus Desulfosporosinus infrequens]|uniref:DUF218 domain-containing protein n=1 Tax=Candidatus Desulfosporosinus infrequens TaxID=2043169 RepID=A0A2U3KPJ3_9FIRM|nr:conserved membrane hypothetical protein [Candidatus Desulfosporosinus infrequens]